MLLRPHVLRRCVGPVQSGCQRPGEARHHADLLHMSGEQAGLPETTDSRRRRLEQSEHAGWRYAPIHCVLEEQRRVRAPAAREWRRREQAAYRRQHPPAGRDPQEAHVVRQAVHSVRRGY